MHTLDAEKERKYLSWPEKVAYGAGDFGSNYMYSFVTNFMLLYLTNSVGMDPLKVGFLMMLSRFLDGVSDVFFGNMIDRTRTRMGKARPWMLWSTFPLAACEILLFVIPDMAQQMQYVYFFVVYTLLNAVFYTANNISYASLTALMTKNPNERVQVGSFRFMWANLAAFLINKYTLGLVKYFGEGAQGWRTVAILYTLVMIAFNMICVFSVRELPVEEDAPGADAARKDAGKPANRISFLVCMKALAANKFYLMIVSYFLLMQIMNAGILGAVGPYFCIYALGDTEGELLGTFGLAQQLPMIAGLAATPFLVQLWGFYRVNLVGCALSFLFAIPLAFAGYMGDVVFMVVFMGLRYLCLSPMTGTLNAVIAEAAAYTRHKTGLRIEGTMYSCSSMGLKVGGGLGAALCGILLSMGGFVDKTAAEAAAKSAAAASAATAEGAAASTSKPEIVAETEAVPTGEAAATAPSASPVPAAAGTAAAESALPSAVETAVAQAKETAKKQSLVIPQSPEAIDMIRFMYLGIPVIVGFLIVGLVAGMNVQKANKEFEEREKHEKQHHHPPAAE